MSYLIKPIKPAMFYAFSRILVWFSELMSALQVCHDMTKFSISDWPRKKDTTWEFCQNSFFYCQSNGCPFLCAICYFHAKTINMYSTIKHKSMFQKLHQKHRTSNLAFLGHSSLPDGSGCMSASFQNCWWCQVCSLHCQFLAWAGMDVGK